jgi:hypothetical protein
MLDTSNDLLTFFSDFAEPVTLTNGQSQTRSISVIWSGPYSQVVFATGALISSTSPACLAKSSDVTGITTDWLITRLNTVYHVRGIEPTEDGLITNLVVSVD